MAWYYIPLIVFFLLGVVLIAFSSYDNKKPMIWGIIIIVITLIIAVYIWFSSML